MANNLFINVVTDQSVVQLYLKIFIFIARHSSETDKHHRVQSARRFYHVNEHGTLN
jgi:hypothetical protein